MISRLVSALAVAVGGMTIGADSAADLPSAPYSEDLGRVGPVWPIAEDDMLDAIRQRAQRAEDSGEATKLEHRMQGRAEAYADTPSSLGLARAVQNRIAVFDPSIVVPYDIKDATGRVLFPAGTTVNPLQHYAFDETLLFVDASDPDQLIWLKQRLAADHTIRDKVVLTGGSPAQLSDVLGQRVFFDQNRALVQKFGIDAVPATVAADPSAPRQRLLVQQYDPRGTSP